jgi:hypothetical protein
MVRKKFLMQHKHRIGRRFEEMEQISPRVCRIQILGKSYFSVIEGGAHV